jgi:hypothetical protein
MKKNSKDLNALLETIDLMEQERAAKPDKLPALQKVVTEAISGEPPEGSNAPDKSAEKAKAN